MRVVTTIEQRFGRTPDGRVWTPTEGARPFWDRYLRVFDEVTVVARTGDLATVPPGWQRVDGDGVSVVTIPTFQGPREYLSKMRAVRRAAQAVASADDAVILRSDSQYVGHIASSLQKDDHPFGFEALTDPFDVFAPGAVEHPLRSFFRWWFTRAMRQRCAQASATAYVTQFTLQKRYPPRPGTFTIHYSDVNLPRDAFAERATDRAHTADVVRLVAVGSLAQMYKAPDVVIEAVARCAAEGLDIRLTWIGDGRYRPTMEALAARCGVGDRVSFLGHLPAGPAVRAELDAADLFLHVSRTEGMPRALIEAMARGLPCIGSTAGGIPELLRHDDLVPPGDADALAEKIAVVATDPQRKASMSERNLRKAREFGVDELAGRQLAFLRSVRDVTAIWQTSQRRRVATPVLS